MINEIVKFWQIVYCEYLSVSRESDKKCRKFLIVIVSVATNFEYVHVVDDIIPNVADTRLAAEMDGLDEGIWITHPGSRVVRQRFTSHVSLLHVYTADSDKNL